MALKKPSELFGKKGDNSKISENINGNLNNIKQQFDKVEELKKELEGVTNSIDSSLSEVVDNSINFVEFKEEYSEFSSFIIVQKRASTTPLPWPSSKISFSPSSNRHVTSDLSFSKSSLRAKSFICNWIYDSFKTLHTILFIFVCSFCDGAI